MKIYITPFIALVAANNGRVMDVSAAAAAAADTAAVARSHPHLRALTDVVVANACDGDRECKRDDQCVGRYCSVSGRNSCGVCCPDYTCNSARDGCPDGSTCDTSAASTTTGCFECRSDVTPSMIEQVEADEEVDTVDNEDGKEANSLRASILKEE
jgi:hypothetical protein